MELKIKYPEYLNIKDWKYFKSLDNDTNTAKMVNFISYLADVPQEEIEANTPQDIQSTYLKILQTFGDVDSKFFPVIEINGVLYGFSALSKMTLGEYMDLERLAKEPNENLEEIMAILYRPITKHSFNGIKWNVIKSFKVGFGKVENLFKYYSIEKYDSSKRAEQADLMATMPVSFALGALAFFLAVASNSLLSTQAYSLPNKKERKKRMEEVKKLVTVPIGDGLLQFITSRKLPSLTSQEIKVLQI
jgi:hypothetical protein